MRRARLDWIVLTVTAALVHAAPVQDEADEPHRAFQVYDSPAVRGRVQSAREHIEGQRWSEALVDLQGLLEEHRGQVLPATLPPLPNGQGTSQHQVFGGASEWATRTLASLPEEARSLYRSRHGAQAARALAAALSAADRAALARVARRFPLTEQAVRAWLALGDLELERGDIEVGIAAWARGLGAALEREVESTSGADWTAALTDLESAAAPGLLEAARPRIAAVLAHLEGEGELAALASEGQHGTALEPGSGLGRLGRNPDTWPKRFELPRRGENPFACTDGKYSLFPSRQGDNLYVSTSRALLAIGAYTGELLWRTPSNFLGWLDVSPFRIDGFAQAIAFDDSLIRPAVERDTVVCALQVPFVFEEEDNYGELEIIRIVPERRLFAFDAATGEHLWDTRPPEGWDGESGGFPERTTVVGSPTIAGTRVLVPAARLRGRIELSVACYDLHSGELSWSTPVLTGQRPLNMFGRLVAEFVAPPVVVAGDRIVVQTQLGTVACLDLFTGEALWHALYDQVVFTPGSYYSNGQLRSNWRNAPPVVVNDTVIAAPLDSHELLGLDLETGAVLWRRGHGELSALARGMTTRLPTIDVLLGADEKHVFLGGRRLVALEAPSGLASEPPRRLSWTYPSALNERIAPGAPRAVIGDDQVYVPRMDRLAVLDRRNGRQTEELEWSRGEGNLLVAEGTLFTLSGYGLAGYFEWDAMLRRARAALAEAPEDPRAVENLALLLHKRGLSTLSSGDYRRARQYLENARSVLDGHATEHPSLRSALHHVLRAEAKNLRLAADPAEALLRLRAARSLAPDLEARRDTLLEEQAVLLERDFTAWLELAALIEDEFARELVTIQARTEGGDSTGWHGVLQPEVAALSQPGSGIEVTRMPVGLWILVERAQGLARRGERGDGGLELSDLHSILLDYGSLSLPGNTSAGAWATDRIAMRIAHGSAEAYRPFEEQARVLLERAKANSDLRLLERIPVLFPHSAAAAASNDAQIDLAIERGDVARASAIALTNLPSDWSPGDATDRELSRLVRLAKLFGEGGNTELRHGLVQGLASQHPDFEVELPGGSVRLAELAKSWLTKGPVAAPESSFPSDLQRTASATSLDDFQSVGLVPPRAGQVGAVQVMSDGTRLLAFGDGVSGTGDPLLWEFNPTRPGLARESLPSDLKAAVQTSPGRVHLVTLERAITLDRDTGEELWAWSSSSGALVAIQASNGVVVVTEVPRDDTGPNKVRLLAFDGENGTPLWSIDLLQRRFQKVPIIGEGFVVLLPESANPVQIIDLFTGSAVASFDLEFNPQRTRTAAWIEHGRIVLPYFLQGQDEEKNHVIAHDLQTGQRAWRVPLSGGPAGSRELSEVLSYDGRHFLNLWPVQEKGAQGAEIGIYELDTRLGALATRPIAELPDDAESIGVKPYQHTYLNGPYLFVLCMPERGAKEHFTVRAIHLRWGERWRTNLPAEFLRTLASDLPQPAVSTSTVALAFPLPSKQVGSRRKRAQIMMLDRSSGRSMGTLDLPDAPGRHFSLSPFGASLLVARSRLLELLR